MFVVNVLDVFEDVLLLVDRERMKNEKNLRSDCDLEPVAWCDERQVQIERAKLHKTDWKA